jgi:cytochrome b
MRTKVWTISIRIFHWLLAIGFTAAYILGDFDSYENLHYAFGLFVGALVLFRLFYGLFGPKYANFKDFPIHIKNQIKFVQNYFNKDKAYIGHNPAASIVMLLIFIVGLFCSISGYLLYSNESAGLFVVGFNKELLEETHEILANLFLFLVVIHIVGLTTDLIFHNKLKAINSIFTGFKNVEGENSKPNNFQKLYTIFWLIIPFFMFYYGYKLEGQNKSSNDNKIEHHEEENEKE